MRTFPRSIKDRLTRRELRELAQLEKELDSKPQDCVSPLVTRAQTLAERGVAWGRSPLSFAVTMFTSCIFFAGIYDIMGSVLAMASRTPNSGIEIVWADASWTELAVRCVVCLAVMVYAMYATDKAGDASTLIRRVSRKTRRLAESAEGCREALELTQRYACARSFRDAVVARGEELRQFHLEAMKKLVEREDPATKDAVRNLDCRALHGLHSAT